MACRWFLVALLVLPPFSAVLAADPASDSIDFDGARLTLGMPQDQVLRLVGEHFRVERRLEDLWWVYSDGGTIGSLYFARGSLVEARRDWEPLEAQAGPAVNTMRTVFGVINQVSPGALRSCKVYPDRLAVQKGFSLSCGPMGFQMYILSEPDGKDRVLVHQWLGSRAQDTGRAPGR